jgi:hypothetical protein
MPNQQVGTEQNQNTDMNQNISTNQNQSGENKQSPNVTGAGETSRSASEDDIGNPQDAVTQDPHRARETGRADTDMNSDTLGGDLSSDS